MLPSGMQLGLQSGKWGVSRVWQGPHLSDGQLRNRPEYLRPLTSFKSPVPAQEGSGTTPRGCLGRIRGVSTCRARTPVVCPSPRLRLGSSAVRRASQKEGELWGLKGSKEGRGH